MKPRDNDDENKSHVCHKNWTDSSTMMESTLAFECAKKLWL